MPQSLQSAIWQAAARQSAFTVADQRSDEDSVDARLPGKDVPAASTPLLHAESALYPEDDLPLQTRSAWYPADELPLGEAPWPQARESPAKDESGQMAVLEEELSRLRRENAALKSDQEQLEFLRRENDKLKCNQAVFGRDYRADNADAPDRTPSPKSLPQKSQVDRVSGCSYSQRSIKREHSRDSVSSRAEAPSAGSHSNGTPRRAVRAVHHIMGREQTPRSTYATSFKTPGAQRRIGSTGPGAARISMARQPASAVTSRSSTPGARPCVVGPAGTPSRAETPKRASSQTRAPNSRLSTPGRQDVTSGSTSGAASRGSSPAPGGHDFIAANIAAAAMPPRPRTVASKAEIPSQAVCQSRNFARDESNVPIYLKQVKAKFEYEQALKQEEQLREQQEASLPPGHRRVPEAERLQVLSELQVCKRDLDARYGRLPLRIDTEAQKRRQRDLEADLREVERQIEQYSRPALLVKA